MKTSSKPLGYIIKQNSSLMGKENNLHILSDIVWNFQENWVTSEKKYEETIGKSIYPIDSTGEWIYLFLQKLYFDLAHDVKGFVHLGQFEIEPSTVHFNPFGEITGIMISEFRHRSFDLEYAFGKFRIQFSGTIKPARIGEEAVLQLRKFELFENKNRKAQLKGTGLSFERSISWLKNSEEFQEELGKIIDLIKEINQKNNELLIQRFIETQNEKNKIGNNPLKPYTYFETIRKNKS